MDEERQDLSRLARGRTVSQALALRARMVLRCADGEDDKEVAEELDIDRNTVGKWRRRFMRRGIEGLGDAPHPNVHRKLQDELHPAPPNPRAQLGAARAGNRPRQEPRPTNKTSVYTARHSRIAPSAVVAKISPTSAKMLTNGAVQRSSRQASCQEMPALGLNQS